MRTRVSISLLVSIACFATLLLCALFFFIHYERAASPLPSSMQVTDVDGFPNIDWDYWKGINPDVIGWITIPGTKVDYPIVQAHSDDPLFYLNHDVTGQWNFMGCPYLDAQCEEEGLEYCMNAVVFAHNLGCGDDSMFAAVARFLDDSFAWQHRAILVQTPDSKTIYSLLGAQCIPGNTEAKRVNFDDAASLSEWLEERLGECATRITAPERTESRILTLCTCSYNYWDDERTLAYASPT